MNKPLIGPGSVARSFDELFTTIKKATDVRWLCVRIRNLLCLLFLDTGFLSGNSAEIEDTRTTNNTPLVYDNLVDFR